MAEQLHFELVTPERLLSTADVYMVVVPGSEGDFGVLAGHAPFMSTIRPGAIAIYPTDGAVPERIFIDGGFAEVNEAGLTILAEGATRLGDIDPAELTRDLAAERENLRLAGNEVEIDIAERRIARLDAMQEALATA
jgi:F-type H+-transporting ATPase subunit epsilon